MKNSAIQWTDHTFNGWFGCRKVAPECEYCYITDTAPLRSRGMKHGKERVRTSEAYWKQPLAWNKKSICGNCGHLYDWDSAGFICGECNQRMIRRQRVFCLSLGDWLDEEVPIEWFVNLLETVHATQNLDWQLLTKRPQNWQQRTPEAFQFAMDNGADQGRQMDFTDWLGAWAHAHIPPSNIWIGVSAGADQKAALEIPAKIHFLSCEPMLHALDTTHAGRFDWIIFGGESGKNARPCNIGWIRHGLRHCRHYEIAVFVKQLGAKPYYVNHDARSEFDHGGGMLELRDSHGGDMSEWPEDLRVRTFPET